MAERWATFDCYGTLIDWNGGIHRELARLFGEDEADAMLGRYHEVEPQIQAETPALPYREVMTEAMRRLGAPAGEEGRLARSLPEWRPFPEVPPALEGARERGWRLGILSNTDRDYIEASLGHIGVQFDAVVVAGEIGSYKPAEGHWRAFEREVGRLPDVHVGASLFHDVAPATRLGLPTVWINRLHDPPDPPPTRELTELSRLPETLDELVPA